MQSDKSSFRFKREEHLKGRKEIQGVFSKGKRYGCQGARLFVLKNNLPYNRICFTFSRVSKKNKVSYILWNAVARNRSRRLGREAFRLMKGRISGGYDLILLIYPESGMALSVRMSQLEFLFSKAGLII